MTGQSLTFQQALDQGVLDASKSSIVLPSSGQTLGLEDAIQQGVFDPRTGTIKDPGMHGPNKLFTLINVYKY